MAKLTWNTLKALNEEKYAKRIKPSIESLLLQNEDPAPLYLYARTVRQAPWPEAEKIIARRGSLSYHYSANILEGPFPLGEPSIAASDFAFYYAKHMLGMEPEIAISWGANYLKAHNDSIAQGDFTIPS